jgi:hypothetical protein
MRSEVRVVGLLTFLCLSLGPFQATLLTRDRGWPLSCLGAGTSVLDSSPSPPPAGEVEESQVKVGMRKETVLARWGEPAEVRKNRTCFGVAEEWVYRGDPERFGAEVRVLFFNEDDVLTEVK